MKKYHIALIGFLTTTSLPGVVVTQGFAAPVDNVANKGSGDVAQLLYQVNRDLVKQQGVIEKTHEAVIDAHNDYVEDPNPSTYKALLRSSQKDAEAVQQYNQLVAQAKSIESKIEQAEHKFYEETPATQAEIETGPVGKGVKNLEGESVESEIPTPPPLLVEHLKQEIKANGGPNSSFADQLRKQQGELKSVKKRIEAEMNSPAVKSNPTATQQDVNIRAALEKAINARRKVIGEQS